MGFSLSISSSLHPHSSLLCLLSIPLSPLYSSVSPLFLCLLSIPLSPLHSSVSSPFLCLLSIPLSPLHSSVSAFISLYPHFLYDYDCPLSCPAYLPPYLPPADCSTSSQSLSSLRLISHSRHPSHLSLPHTHCSTSSCHSHSSDSKLFATEECIQSFDWLIARPAGSVAMEQSNVTYYTLRLTTLHDCQQVCNFVLQRYE